MRAVLGFHSGTMHTHVRNPRKTNISLKKRKRASQMAPPVKAFAVKPGDLNLILEIHVMERTDSSKLSHDFHMQIPRCKHSPERNK